MRADATASIAPYAPVPGSVYGYSDSIAHDAWTPKVGIEMKLPHDALAYVSATRGFKSGGFNPSSTVPGRGYAPEWAWSYEGGLKGTLMDGRSRFAVSAFFDGLHEPASADAHRHRRVRHPQCGGGDDSRRRSGEHVTDRPRLRSRRSRHLARRDLRSLHRRQQQQRRRRRLGQPVEQCAGVGGPPLGRVERRHRSVATAVDRRPTRRHSRRCSTRRSTTTSSFRDRTACSAPASNTAPAIVAGPSPRTPETSPTRTTSRRPSGRRRWRLADVLDLSVSSRSISPSGDKTVTLGVLGFEPIQRPQATDMTELSQRLSVLMGWLAVWDDFRNSWVVFTDPP